MKGDFILQARVRVPRQGRRPASQGGLDRAQHARRGLALRRRRRARRRPDVAAVPAHQGRDHRADRPPSRARTSSSSSARATPTPCPRRASASRSPPARSPTSTWATRCYVGLFLCSHNAEVVEKAVFRDVRIIRPAKDGFVPYRDYIGSGSRSSTSQTGRRQIVHELDAAVRGAQLDAGRQRAHLQHAAAGRKGADACIASTSRRGSRRSSTPASQPQQQRPRAVVRRHDARHQRSEHARASPPSSRCRSAAARRSGSRR